MFESDNTRKLKTEAEGKKKAQHCIAVSHPLCVLCYYFLKYQPNTHPADSVNRNASSIFFFREVEGGGYSKKKKKKTYSW